jgi:hypothetical protein
MPYDASAGTLKTGSDAPMTTSMCVNPTIEQLQGAITQKEKDLTDLLQFFRDLAKADAMQLHDGHGEWTISFKED